MCFWGFISARTCHRRPLSCLSVSNAGQCLCEHVAVLLRNCVVPCAIGLISLDFHRLILYISDHSVANDRVQMGKLCVVSCVWSVMQCSTAMDILFVMDSSYSVGKGGFERSRHYVLKLCEALDVSKDKVRLHKLRLREKFSQNWKIAIIYLPMCNFNRLCYNYVGLFVLFKLHSLFWAGESWRDSVWFHTQAGNQSRLLQEQRGAEEKDEENPL